MLIHLHIKNLAIVRDLTLNFFKHMSAITGETGAGKSVLLNAILLIVGAKAKRDLIAPEATKAEICAEFNIAHYTTLINLLKQHELLDDDNPQLLTIRRIISTDGKSRAFINGYPITINFLRGLSDKLLYFHGQHQHLDLLDNDFQLTMLDEFAGNDALLAQLHTIYQKWLENLQQLKKAREELKVQATQQELLEYQIAELNDANLLENEWEEINSHHKKLCEEQNNLAKVQAAYDYLNSSNDSLSVSAQLQAALKQIKKLNSCAANAQALEEAITVVNEVENNLKVFLDQYSVENSSSEIEKLDQRIAQLHALARKHNVAPQEISLQHAKLTQALQKIATNENLIDELENIQQQLIDEYHKVAEVVSQQRQQHATEFQQQIMEILAHLKMPQAKLAIMLQPREKDEVHPRGIERCDFMIATNPKQQLKAMKNVVSGGELARLALAIQIVKSQKNHAPSLILDEADVGIGGATAATLGLLLAKIAAKTQIICITHSPQVAACAKQHYHATKETADHCAKVSLLSEKERINELARMLGGVDVTPQSLANATTLLHEHAMLD